MVYFVVLKITEMPQGMHYLFQAGGGALNEDVSRRIPESLWAAPLAIRVFVQGSSTLGLLASQPCKLKGFLEPLITYISLSFCFSFPSPLLTLPSLHLSLPLFLSLSLAHTHKMCCKKPESSILPSWIQCLPPSLLYRPHCTQTLIPEWLS